MIARKVFLAVLVATIGTILLLFHHTTLSWYPLYQSSGTAVSHVKLRPLSMVEQIYARHWGDWNKTQEVNSRSKDIGQLVDKMVVESMSDKRARKYFLGKVNDDVLPPKLTTEVSVEEKTDDSADKSKEENTTSLDEAEAKYLIYLCDKKVKCSGFADRQRAIVGLYLLSLATHRRFGIIMNEPANLRDFYRPNKVMWELNMTHVHGKPNVELRCLKPNPNCIFGNINVDHPQDVVYVRSKQNFLSLLYINQTYQESLPHWTRVDKKLVFGPSWIRLMKPTETLRRGINDILKRIARDMRQDAYLIPKLSSGHCKTACGQILDLKKTEILSIDKCFWTLPTYDRDISKQEKATYFRHICPVQTAFTPPTDDVIDASKGYEYVDLQLVCVQIRIGRSSTIDREPVLNRIEDLDSVWRVVRPYVNQGRHVFLATDSLEVRDIAKSLFGPRVHMNSDPIVHLNKVREDQDAWAGMRFALMEQLFLSTSCRVLIYTQTGFGSRSADVRRELMREQTGLETFTWKKGRVTRDKRVRGKRKAT